MVYLIRTPLKQIETLVNSLLNNSESRPYGFYINDIEVLYLYLNPTYLCYNFLLNPYPYHLYMKPTYTLFKPNLT
jgi:hypothetical protein